MYKSVNWWTPTPWNPSSCTSTTDYGLTIIWNLYSETTFKKKSKCSSLGDKCVHCSVRFEMDVCLLKIPIVLEKVRKSRSMANRIHFWGEEW